MHSCQQAIQQFSTQHYMPSLTSVVIMVSHDNSHLLKYLLQIAISEVVTKSEFSALNARISFVTMSACANTCHR